MAKNIYVYLIILLIIGIMVGGCISTKYFQESINNTVNYREREKMPITPAFELEINSTDNYTKNIIYSALEKTDHNATAYISSINIVSNIIDSPCGNDSTGCTIGNFTANGKLLEVKIYILNPYSYKGLCNTFEHTLYHEIGHVVYFYKFGNQDPLYIESLELYADKYADKYYNVKKEGCDEELFQRLKQQLDEKEKIYLYSIKVLSKWDKYKDNGIPKDEYDEYVFDHDLYEDAKKEYAQ
jgi:hypothetical protein